MEKMLSPKNVTKNNFRNTDHNLRNQDFFTMPLVRIEWFRKFPVYALANEWNNLGDNIRLQHNRTTFKIALLDDICSQLPKRTLRPTHPFPTHYILSPPVSYCASIMLPVYF
jgi:hypothetical protein